MKTKNFLKLTFAAMVVVAALTACGDDNGGDTQSTLPKVEYTGKKLRSYSREMDDWNPVVYKFEYDENGLLKKASYQGDSHYDYDYKWDGDKLSESWQFKHIMEAFFREMVNYYSFKGNRLQREESVNDTCLYEYKGGNLAKYCYTSSSLGYYEMNFDYENGRIAKITKVKNGEEGPEVSEYTFSYDGKTCNGMCYNVFADMIRKPYERNKLLFMVHPELVGIRSKYLPSKMSWTKKSKSAVDSSSSEYKWKYTVETHEKLFDWVVDESGCVTKFTERENVRTVTTYSTEDYNPVSERPKRRASTVETSEVTGHPFTYAFQWN